MRIKEEFKKSGYFWLPSEPEIKVQGILSIADGGNIELETLDLLNVSDRVLDSKDRVKRIFGEIEDNVSVIINDCLCYKSIFPSFSVDSIKDDGFKLFFLIDGTTFIGTTCDEDEDILLNNLTFSVEGLDEWVGINVNNSNKISYSQSEEILFDLNNGMKLSIIFDYKPSSGGNITEEKITPKAYFKLISSEKGDVKDFISIAEKITTLLCFAIDEIVCLDDIKSTIQDDNNNLQIEIYYRSYHYFQKKPKITKLRMLFRYVQSDFDKIINKWINIHKDIEPAIDLYFSTKLGHQKHLNGKFLALAQGLEAFHRGTSNEKNMSDEEFKNDEEFKKLFDLLVDHCPENHKKWLEDKLSYTKEISLRQRIREIIKPFNNLIEPDRKKRETIIDKIVNKRNSLTHPLNKSLKDKVVTGQDLVYHYLKMEALFQLNLLSILGFTPEEIKSIFDDNDQLKEKLKKN